MHRYVLPLAAAASMATPLAAADIQIQAQGPVVELNISESVDQQPDIAEIGAGVTTQAQSAVEAMQANARAMNAVIAQIEALGIAERDIQTSGINLSPQYDYDQETRRQIFRGYQVSNRVQVTLRDIERAGETLDTLVAAGATDLSGLNWSVDDPSGARAQARQNAMDAGREQALAYARQAGYSDIRLLKISEAVPFERPQPYMRLEAQAARAADSTPVRPGQVESGVSITVVYEMTR